MQLHLTYRLLPLAVVLLLFFPGCYKDYSYEYKPPETSILNTNTPTVTASCAICQSAQLPDSSWKVVIDGTIFCGEVVKPVIMPERTAFTFFGPSFCSADSGFVASVFLGPDVLNGDKQNLRARMSCYYYDKVAPSHAYMSSSAEPLEVIIESYTHQTGVATGTFRGVVFDTSGRRKEVKNGRFRIRL